MNVLRLYKFPYLKRFSHTFHVLSILFISNHFHFHLSTHLNLGQHHPLVEVCKNYPTLFKQRILILRKMIVSYRHLPTTHSKRFYSNKIISKISVNQAANMGLCWKLFLFKTSSKPPLPPQYVQNTTFEVGICVWIRRTWDTYVTHLSALCSSLIFTPSSTSLLTHTLEGCNHG